MADPGNLYSETTAGKLSPAVAGDLPRVYVPHVQSNDVWVIDPATRKVVDKFKVGVNPQHVVPSWDLRTLWVANNAEGRRDGSLTPIDPSTGKPGKPIPVDDPYNMYFTPDGKSAIVVAEAFKRLDFRDPKTMALQSSLAVAALRRHQPRRLLDRRPLRDLHLRVRRHRRQDRPGRAQGAGLHPASSSRACRPTIVKGVDGRDETVCTSWKGMPQDIRVSPDGKLFFVADMMADGVYVVDGATLPQVGFIPTGVGTHGLYPSRDGTKLYVANRGSNRIHGRPQGKGSVSVARLRDPQGRGDLADPRRRQPRHGQRQRRRQGAWLSRPLRRRRLRHRHRRRQRDDESRWARNRTGSPSGRSRAAIRSATPATCASAAGPRWSAIPPRSPENHAAMLTSLVVTVIGPDRPGLVSELSDRGKAHGASWAESRMQSLAGQFAGIVRFEVDAARAEPLAAALAGLEALGLRVVIARGEEDVAGAGFPDAEAGARRQRPAGHRPRHLARARRLRGQHRGTRHRDRQRRDVGRRPVSGQGTAAGSGGAAHRGVAAVCSRRWPTS